MLGILGGSGLYQLEVLEDVREAVVATPFGDPSCAYVCGRLHAQDVCFLPRHGKGHRLLPSEINHRANIFGFKLLGVDRVLSVSAVGSLREDLHPEDILLPDQYFDRTRRPGEQTFFGRGIAGHVSFGEPTCAVLRAAVEAAATRVIKTLHLSSRVHVGGTYVNMEGPAFSTKAESNFYRQCGFDVIGMTSMTEAKLCREAEICYQAAAMVTDYDCWHETAGEVSVDLVIKHLLANVAVGKALVAELAGNLPETRDCCCASSLQHAVITDAAAIPASVREDLAPLLGKYWGEDETA